MKVGGLYTYRDCPVMMGKIMERSKKKIMFLDAATAEWKLLLAVWAKSQEP